MKSQIVLAIAMAIALVDTSLADQDKATAPSEALTRNLQVCSECHGPQGRSIAPTFPNLAAQSAAYVETQLKAFKEQTRADPDAQAYMWGMASLLSDAEVSELAQYFSKQPPARGKTGDAVLINKGRRIFEEGVPDLQIPSCSTCHGKKAEGMGSFPRLAGQHPPYLLKQLLVIQNALRNAPVMHGIVKDLSRDQMLAVTAYLGSLDTR